MKSGLRPWLKVLTVSGAEKFDKRESVLLPTLGVNDFFLSGEDVELADFNSSFFTLSSFFSSGNFFFSSFVDSSPLSNFFSCFSTFGGFASVSDSDPDLSTTKELSFFLAAADFLLAVEGPLAPATGEGGATDELPRFLLREFWKEIENYRSLHILSGDCDGRSRGYR